MTLLPTVPFWMVYGIGAGRPTQQHPDERSAKAEAERLARANPRVVFVVLQSVHAIVKDDLKHITFKASSAVDLDDDIPF